MLDSSVVAATKRIPERLFVLELANNHMGDVAHGLHVIEEFGKVAKEFDFPIAFKLQFRELDSFIHPAYKNRNDIKYIKRFSETRLDGGQIRELVEGIKANGFLTMCTPFDEASVDRIVEGGFDILKIASCSFTDWPLLEKIVRTDMPIVGSTAGIPFAEMDNVVSFLNHRAKAFALMACVAQYPTPCAALNLNQIDVLKERYPGLRVGYSTHEDPDETMPIAMAIAKGASIFEKHVGIATEKYALNNYSANPEQVRRWLAAAKKSFEIAGVVGERIEPTAEELKSLRDLRRGVFLKRAIGKGERIATNDIFFAIPAQPGQITANEWSKYSHFTATTDLVADAPVMAAETNREFVQGKVQSIVSRVKDLLTKSNGVVPCHASLELSHHYGLERFDEYGITMVTVVNRDYCKKLIAVLPGQKHPEQFHKRKEETFHVLHGDLLLQLDGEEQVCTPGSVVTIAPGVRHAFESKTGAVFEEISSTHFANDSFYTHAAINTNASRKTLVRYWTG